MIVALPLICAALPTAARAEAPTTSATIAPSLAPDKLGVKATLTLTIRYAGGEFGMPAPVRKSILRLPAGMSLNIPHLSSCSPARLRARGPRGCPAQAEIGRGNALMGVHAGTENITENAALWAFLGPPRNLQPTFEIFAQGHTPVDESMVLRGEVLPASAPYGEELTLSIPPIPTLRLEPYASVLTFTLTIGARAAHGRRRNGNAVVVPASCPAGGFPFATETTYAGDFANSATAMIPCPQ